MLNHLEYTKNYLTLIKNAIDNVNINELAGIIEILEIALKERRKIFLAGNGGSAATADHMANDLMLGVAKQQQKGFRTIPLIGHTATLTALANDMDYAHIFSGQIKHLADPGDILIVISASGNSANVVHALTEAKNIGMYSIAFLGMDGGEAAAIADKKIIAPSYAYGPIEDLHMIFDHIITGYFQQ